MSEMVEMTFTVDADLLEAAERLFAEQGVTMEEVVNRLFEESVRIGGLPFEVDEELRAVCGLDK